MLWINGCRFSGSRFIVFSLFIEKLSMARKKVIFTEEQLNEIIGGDTTYLDAADKDFREFAGHNEVTVGGKDGLNRQDAEPITGDKISDAMGRS